MRTSLAWLAPPAVVAAVAVLANRPTPAEAPATQAVVAEAEQLEARRVVAVRRRAVQAELTAALAEGRIPLGYAAAEFRALYAGDETTLATIRAKYRGASDDERLARHAIARVAERPMPADQKARVLARLEGELAGTFGPVALAVR